MVPGELSHHFTGTHGYGLSPEFETVTPGAAESDRRRDHRWRPSSIGYLPPDIRVDVSILRPSRATYVNIPERIFREAAFETIDADALDYRWLTNIEDPAIYGMIKTLEQLHQASDITEWPLMTESIGTAMAIRSMQLLGARPRPRSEPYPEGLSTQKLQLVQQYIDDNISQPMTLSELAGVATLSTFHFARAFTKSMNISPVRYVWRRRIERAQHLLKRTGATLTEVALDCGFSSQSHFTTLFRKALGVTPSAWRAAVCG